MQSVETIEQFYGKNPAMKMPDINSQIAAGGHFNVFSRADLCGNLSSYSRRDFYKVSLIMGGGTLYYADKGIVIQDKALKFSNPNVPYSWEASPNEQTGYFCLFSEDFITSGGHRESFLNSPLFKIGSDPVYFINDGQAEMVKELFHKMIAEINTDYIYKYDLVRNYLDIIVHEALKMKPADNYFKHSNASERIAGLFIDMLERQFPIDSPDYALKLKSATDYSNRLSVHVNHLNRAVKEVTGKTTTVHIAERIIKEAKALLKHTDWNVADIAYSLGFEYPAYFNNFFKKQTGVAPGTFRI